MTGALDLRCSFVDAQASRFDAPLPLTGTPTAALVLHGLYLTHAERLNRHLLAFIEGEQHLAAPLGRAGVLYARW